MFDKYEFIAVSWLAYRNINTRNKAKHALLCTKVAKGNKI